MSDNVWVCFQDGKNLDSPVYKELETRAGPDHGDLWKLS